MDTDGDGINDAVESPACVGGPRREPRRVRGLPGMHGQLRSVLCGAPRLLLHLRGARVVGRLNLREVIDDVAYVVDAHGRRYNLHPDHMPMWVPASWAVTAASGGRAWGTWSSTVGSNAYPQGKRLGLDRPPPDPPFCHPDVIRVDKVGG